MGSKWVELAVTLSLINSDANYLGQNSDLCSCYGYRFVSVLRIGGWGVGCREFLLLIVKVYKTGLAMAVSSGIEHGQTGE